MREQLLQTPRSLLATCAVADRMQAAAPDLVDLSKEDGTTLYEYGIDCKEPEVKADRGGGKGLFPQFAAICLLARRLIERGM